MNLKKNRSTLLLGGASAALALAAAAAIAHPGGQGRGGPGKGLSLERLDSDGDGVVSLVEMQDQANKRLARKLQRLDSDGDGVVTVAEREALAAQMEAHGHRKGRFLQRGPAEDMTVVDMEARLSDRVAKRFAKMDGNADGVLDASELEAAKAKRRARWEARRARTEPAPQ
ncbi:MAG: hypothetical protein AAFU79_01475 [Myxococcota bacterium]